MFEEIFHFLNSLDAIYLWIGYAVCMCITYFLLGYVESINTGEAFGYSLIWPFTLFVVLALLCVMILVSPFVFVDEYHKKKGRWWR